VNEIYVGAPDGLVVDLTALVACIRAPIDATYILLDQ